jgi:AcrR family transcriptional regulator
MKNTAHHPLPARPYRQTARAAAAEATARHILDVFNGLMRSQWFDEITLDEVARRAGVNVRTVIRRYGSKEGLLTCFAEAFVSTVAMERETPVGDVAAAVGRLIGVYETWGDSVVRNLAQEPRHPALKPMMDLGRSRHRAITAQTYAPWLEPLAEPDQQRTLDALVAATDVYVWKLARRDMGRSREETSALLQQLVDAVLAQAAVLAANPRNPS